MNNKRGPYKRTRMKMELDTPSSFFREEHEFHGFYITWADAVVRCNDQISVLYKIAGDKKQYRCPRYKTIIFDQMDLEGAKFVVSKWKKDNNNTTGKGDFLPNYYLEHRNEFIKWLGATARHSTIVAYECFLRIYIFPYFVGKLKIEKPTMWDEDAISRWKLFLEGHLPKAGSRNKVKTALRRYLKFLKHKNELKRIPQVFNDANRRKSTETPIPGTLPEWSDVVSWLKSLPKGRYRFIRAVMMGFGLRISEACMVDECDFFGAESEDHINQKNDFIRELKNKGIGKLFLYVNKAEKKKVDKDFIKILGIQCTEPKSGPYTACCTNIEIASFIVNMIENRENEELLTKDDVYRIKDEMPIDHSPFLFHRYKLHDDRRLNITLQMFDLKIPNAIEICCMLHGQSSQEVFRRYFQWGLLQKRKLDKYNGRKLKLF